MLFDVMSCTLISFYFPNTNPVMFSLVLLVTWPLLLLETDALDSVVLEFEMLLSSSEESSSVPVSELLQVLVVVAVVVCNDNDDVLVSS